MKRVRAPELIHPDQIFELAQEHLDALEAEHDRRWGPIYLVRQKPSWISDMIRVLSGGMPRGRYWPLPRFLAELIVDTITLAVKLRRKRAR